MNDQALPDGDARACCAFRFVEAGESRHEVAARFGIAASTVIKWLARYAKTGSAAPAQMGR
jgi:putative transposase